MPRMPPTRVLALSLILLAAACPPVAGGEALSFLLRWGSRGSLPGQFDGLTGVATDASGNVYVADGVNRRVQKFTATGTFLSEFAGPFTSSPLSLAIDPTGRILVSDGECLYVFSGAGSFIARWGDPGDFGRPYGVATDQAGNVYVSDPSSSQIRKFDPSGTLLTEWGTEGSAPGELFGPNGLAIDAAGFVYVADRFNQRVQKFTADGTYVGHWGVPGIGEGEFASPNAVAVGPAGDIYVLEFLNRRVQRFTPSGAYLAKWGSFGSAEGQFRSPFGIATDAAGNVYVTDTLLSWVQKFGDVPTPAIGSTWGRMKAAYR